MPETAIKTTNSNLDKKVNIELAHEENVDISSFSLNLRLKLLIPVCAYFLKLKTLQHSL